MKGNGEARGRKEEREWRKEGGKGEGGRGSPGEGGNSEQTSQSATVFLCHSGSTTFTNCAYVSYEYGTVMLCQYLSLLFCVSVAIILSANAAPTTTVIFFSQ